MKLNRFFNTIIFTFFLSLQYSAVSAQSWQWQKRMGGNATYINTEDSREEVFSLKIDKSGNSYILFRTCTDLINPNKILIDTTVLNRNFNGQDFALVSFDCAGKFRWGKLFGGPGGDSPVGMGIDTLGGIYIAAHFNRGAKDSIMLDDDTILRAPTTYPYRENRGIALIKYDSAGNYKWIRFPEPDTMTFIPGGYGNRSVAIDMAVSPDGTISMLTALRTTGAFASGAYIVPSSIVLPAVYIFQYNRNGSFVKGISLPITNGVAANLYASDVGLKMAWDWRYNAFYIRAQKDYLDPPLSFGGIPQTGSTLLAKFNNAGSILWRQETTTTKWSGSRMDRPVIDPNGDLYFGYADYVGAVFGGLTIPDPYLFLKMNSSGKVLWHVKASGEYGVAMNTGAYSSAGNKVSFYGSGPGKMSIGTHNVYGYYTSIGVMQYVVDANTGSEISFDTLRGSGFANANAFCADRHGNFYSTFSYNARLYVGADTLFKFGGYTDVALVKWGEASCDPIPGSGIADASPATMMKVYPNPAQDRIFVENAPAGTTLRLYNLLGAEVYSGVVGKTQAASIPLTEGASGMYLLHSEHPDGTTQSFKIMKE